MQWPGGLAYLNCGWCEPVIFFCENTKLSASLGSLLSQENREECDEVDSGKRSH